MNVYVASAGRNRTHVYNNWMVPLRSWGFTIHDWASSPEWDEPSWSLDPIAIKQRNTEALNEADALVVVVPECLSEGMSWELGFAEGRRIPTVLVVEGGYDVCNTRVSLFGLPTVQTLKQAVSWLSILREI